MWLNYNSSKILKVVLRSLESIENLNYEKYLLLIIDNGSTDRSIDAIEKYVQQSYTLRSKTKIIKLNHNLGFTGAHNIAWKYLLSRYPGTKFLAFLNNDARVTSESLDLMTELLKSFPRTSGIQGIIKIWNTRLIDTFGNYVDELLNTFPFMNLRNINEAPFKCFIITYADGSYCVYKVSILKKIMLKGNDIFPSYSFAYLDDNLLGILSYLNGYNVLSVPIAVGEHYRGLTFRKILGTMSYFSDRSHIAQILLINTRYKIPALLNTISDTIRRALINIIARKRLITINTSIRAMYDGILLAKAIKVKYGLNVKGKCISKIPLIKLQFKHVLERMVPPRRRHMYIIKHIENAILGKYGFKCI